MDSTITKQERVRLLCDDLQAEQQDLQRILAQLKDDDWERQTPAIGWTIFDQVAHLAHFDFITRLAIRDPERFVAIREQIPDLQTYVDLIGPANLSRMGRETLAWWNNEAALLRAAIIESDPQVRVPWFGPSMSLASKITARIMETWAHGQDIVDTLGIKRVPTARLEHVARIGVLAFANSFTTNALQVPSSSVRVELTTPNGDVWRAGNDDTDQVVTGSLEDFCLVVTQRRHIDDTNLVTQGDTAERWMSIAQAFAGPPGTGRRPGQFTALASSKGISS